MNVTSVALTEDLPQTWLLLAGALALVSVFVLGSELRRKGSSFRWVFFSGIAATIAFIGAIARPVSVTAKSTTLGPRIVVLMDESRRLLIPEQGQTRRELANSALESLREHYADARLEVLGFGAGVPKPYTGSKLATQTESDLVRALGSLVKAPGERPRAVVVVSDGRLSSPAASADRATVEQFSSGLNVPIHTVGLLDEAPADASVRSVRAAGAAVAHQPLSITVEVGCDGGLSCAAVPVKVRELLLGEPPLELSSGVVNAESGTGSIELEATLDRAGSRVVEVSISAPKGDLIPHNDVRTLTFSVAKERVRLLHLAGRPTYDVRALRTWLKSDESVDVVAFFILRGDTDDPGANESDLALIRFPVDELFVEHLPSFDAVILQDIDAQKYKLARHLPRLRDYVKKGGGLIMVGGPSSFAGGNYAGTPIDAVLPLEQPRQGKSHDSGEFVPMYTEAGRAAPVTRVLRSLLDNRLPRMAGANLLGPPRDGAIVLLEHPELQTAKGPMPVLALGEAGDGRAISLALDSTHRLAFGEAAASVKGRAYGALWDGLLGWLMRDPRYEAARVEVVGECIEGEPIQLRVHRLPGMVGDIEVSLEPLVAARKKTVTLTIADNRSSTVDVQLPGQAAGGYAVRVAVGAAPATRHDLGCERGGSAWSDSRPDNARLALLADASGGRHVGRRDISELPQSEVTQVTAERHVSPIFPPWIWALVSSALLGVHWIARRKGGLS
jgi:uncharacterized membrane protein